MLDKIKKCDFLSNDVNLYFENGSTNFKSPFGGIFSILTVLAFMSFFFYFGTNFIDRKDIKLVTNLDSTNNFNITSYSDIPFMIRASYSGGVAEDNPLSIYNIIGQLRYVPDDPNDPRSKTQTVLKLNITMEQCDINNTKHFNIKYKHLFENNTDTNTFLCPKYENPVHIYGLYGDIKPFSYMNYFIRPCRPQDDGNETCADSEKIKFLLSGAYIDIRTLDYKIDNFSKTTATPIAVGLRWQQTNTLFKRTYIYYRTINYSTDIGYVFKDESKQNFFQIHEIINDVDIRDFERNDIRGAYGRISIENYKESLNYYRSYMKAQELLALLGGILSSLKFISIVINYFISKQLYNINLLNSLPDILYMINMKKEQEDDNFNKKAIKTKHSDIQLKYKVNKFGLNELIHENTDTPIIKPNNQNKLVVNHTRINQNNNSEFINSNRILNDNDIPWTVPIENLEALEKNLLSINFQGSIKKEVVLDFKSKKFENEFVNFQNPIKLNDKEIYIPPKKIKKIQEPSKLNFSGLKINPCNLDSKYINERPTIHLNVFEIIIPFICFCNKNIKIMKYINAVKLLEHEMEICHIINQINQIEKLKENLFDTQQLLVFNKLYNLDRKKLKGKS